MLELNSKNFEEVVKANQYVFVDFWAAWCGPCKAVAPVLDEVDKEFADRILFGKVDIDSCQEIAMKHGVFTIPNMCLFKDGKLVDRIVGNKAKKDITKFLTKQLEKTKEKK